MKIALCHLRSLSPYSQSRVHDTPKLTDKSGKIVEGADDWDERTWREHCHADENGNIIIPPSAFNACVKEAAGYLSIRRPGKGTSTWTKNFRSGVQVVDPLVLPLTKDSVKCEKLHMSAKGIKGSGGGSRVWRRYPVVPSWSGIVKFYVFDDEITEEVFKLHLVQAGMLIGIGRFRVSVGGWNGRFVVEKIEWEDGVTVAA